MTQQRDIQLTLANLKQILDEVGIESRELDSAEIPAGYALALDEQKQVGGFAYIFPETGQFVLYLFFVDQFPLETIAHVGALINRINNRLLIGNFEIDYDEQAVRFKIGIDFFGMALPALLIRNALTDAIETVEMFSAAIVAVANGQKTVPQVLKDL